MSGRKQHYIPQNLLRGFQDPNSGKMPQVFVFRKGVESYKSSIADVAAQRDFYSGLSDSGKKTLDDHITTYEYRLASFLQQLRAAPANTVLAPSLAAEVVGHLTFRAAFVRDLLTVGVQEFAEHATAFFSNTEAVRKYLGIDREEPLAILNEELDKAIDLLESSLPEGVPRHFLKRVLLVWIRENFDGNYNQKSSATSDALAYLGQTAAVFVRGSHLKILDQSLVPDLRVAALSNLTWMVADVSEPLLLPDCVAVSLQAGARDTYVPYLLHGNEELVRVLVPLSSCRLLVGSRGDFDSSSVSVSGFNEAAAACAAEFFVCARSTGPGSQYADLIGSASKSKILDEVRDAMMQFSGGSERRETPSAVSQIETQDGVNAIEPGPPFSYSISFIGCATQETAEKIAQAIRVVFDSLSREVSLDRVESITYADDYGKALADLDRGFDTTKTLTPTDSEYGTGVAMAPLVLREGRIRCCIVIRGWLGTSLLASPHEDVFLLSIHILSSMLARAGFVGLVDEAMPGLLLNLPDDHLDRLVLSHVYEACSSYFAARITANIQPESKARYCELLRAALHNADEVIVRLRLEYRRGGDLDALLDNVIPVIGDFLHHAATVLGHFDGLSVSMLAEQSETESLLQGRGLLSWLEVFRRDLELIYDRRGQWSSAKEFLNLGIHVERLLWMYSIFAWRLPEGKLWVKIPLGVDAAALSIWSGGGGGAT